MLPGARSCCVQRACTRAAHRHSLLALQMKGKVLRQFWSFQPQMPCARLLWLKLPATQLSLLSGCAEPQLP